MILFFLIILQQQDIVEFLNIKVREYEDHVNQLEAKVRELDEEKRVQDIRAKAELENATQKWKLELEQVQSQSLRYKGELDLLSEFKLQKVFVLFFLVVDSVP